jgi:hypothetical protein
VESCVHHNPIVVFLQVESLTCNLQIQFRQDSRDFFGETPAHQRPALESPTIATAGMGNAGALAARFSSFPLQKTLIPFIFILSRSSRQKALMVYFLRYCKNYLDNFHDTV